jgi:hypothetical protein
MANYDKPAIVWNVIGKTFINPDTFRDEFDFPSISDPAWVAERADTVNAWAALGGGGGTEVQLINGYGYSQSG